MPPRGDWCTSGWPTKVDLVPLLYLHPRPHLHSRFGMGARAFWGLGWLPGAPRPKLEGEGGNPGGGSRSQAPTWLPPTKWSDVPEVCFAGTLCSEAENEYSWTKSDTPPPLLPPRTMDILLFMHLLDARLRFCLFSESSGLN